MLDVATLESHVLQFAIAEALQCEHRGLALAVGNTRCDQIVNKVLRAARNPFKVESRSCQHWQDVRARPAKHEDARRQQYRDDGGDDCCNIKSIHKKLHCGPAASVAAGRCMGYRRSATPSWLGTTSNRTRVTGPQRAPSPRTSRGVRPYWRRKQRLK